MLKAQMRLPRLHRTRSSTAHDKAVIIIADFILFVNGYRAFCNEYAFFYEKSEINIDILLFRVIISREDYSSFLK